MHYPTIKSLSGRFTNKKKNPYNDLATLILLIIQYLNTRYEKAMCQAIHVSRFLKKTNEPKTCYLEL